MKYKIWQYINLLASKFRVVDLNYKRRLNDVNYKIRPFLIIGIDKEDPYYIIHLPEDLKNFGWPVEEDVIEKYGVDEKYLDDYALYVHETAVIEGEDNDTHH